MIAELAARLLYFSGTRHMNRERHLAATRRFLASLACAPASAPSWLHLGNCLLADNDAHAALGCFRKAMALAPNAYQPRMNAGMALLALGEWQEGWELYESRFASPGFRKFNGLRNAEGRRMWRGERLAGKSIFVFNEQGIGDTIMTLRYVEMLAAQGAKVAVRVPENLRRLGEATFADRESIHLVSDTDAVPEDALIVPFMSLPGRLGRPRSATPAPYLRLNRSDPPVQFFGSQNDSRLRVGLVWSGQAYPKNRSIPIEQLAPLFKLSGVRWFSLQLGPRASDIDRFVEVERFAPADFYATARGMKALDMVVTIDSAPAHLAGALNVPVWTMLQHGADWRWGLRDSSTHWYPSMVLFRQKRRGDWSTVVEEIRAGLAMHANSRRAS
jgi:tetratricopeptide (TPR) repeat protein